MVGGGRFVVSEFEFLVILLEVLLSVCVAVEVPATGCVWRVKLSKALNLLVRSILKLTIQAIHTENNVILELVLYKETVGRSLGVVVVDGNLCSLYGKCKLTSFLGEGKSSFTSRPVAFRGGRYELRRAESGQVFRLIICLFRYHSSTGEVDRRYSAEPAASSPVPLLEHPVRVAKVFEVIGIDLAVPLFLLNGDKVRT
ncbi:hypothetical protein TNCV_709191 [Trichonephila clavipes]|nr:hypothetical protein TNCV_709191 [Trichonephila clavipes]